MRMKCVRRAAEIRTLAERQMGEFLKAMPKAKGAPGNPGGQGAEIVRSPEGTARHPRRHRHHQEAERDHPSPPASA